MAQLNASPLGLTLDSINTAKSGMVGYGDGTEIESRFNHPNNNTILFTPWPDGPMDDKGKPAKRRNIHSDDIYDVRLKNIIDISDSIYTVDKSGSTHFPTRLKAMDFVYLKNVGVYPNNRLMVARRYGGPVVDDPTAIKQSPISTMISWVPDGEDFLKFDFGEEWEESDADFTEIFNSVGKDVMGKLGDKLGGFFGEGGGSIPLPGFSEGLQRKLMVAIGLAGKGSDEYIPAGEPNLIKQAKKRKTIGYGEKGSSLKANVSIKMVCEWEQKFIAGVDPSIAWMDIMNTAMKFGTSPAKFYLGKGGGENVQKVRDFINGMANKPLETLQKLMETIANDISDLVDTIARALNGEEDKDKEANKPSIESIKSELNSAVSNVLKTIAKKYQIRLQGVINALTGAPSTPWHVTLGNPMRPVFCSGDMLVEQVEITLGPELAFNDLPSTIKAEFTLKNARPLGMDELLGKFNVGYTRTVKVKKDLYTSQKDSDFIPPDDQTAPKLGTQSPPITNIGNKTAENTNFLGAVSSSASSEFPGTGVSGTGISGQTRVGNLSVGGDSVNPDANSEDVMSSNLNSFANKNSQQDLAESKLLGITGG